MSEHDEEFEDEESEEEEETDEDLSELEEEFRKTVEAHSKEIEKQLEIAAKAIQKAEKLSEKYGIPFYSSVTPLGMGYTPASYYEKYSDLDSETVYDITGACPGGEYGSEGWEHSDVC